MCLWQMQSLFECEFPEGSSYDTQLKDGLGQANSTEVQKQNSKECDGVRLNLKSCVEENK